MPSLGGSPDSETGGWNLPLIRWVNLAIVGDGYKALLGKIQEKYPEIRVCNPKLPPIGGDFLSHSIVSDYV